ncbi:MAG TPA: hypothetical protein VFZ09_26520 [Archangium sp.]|uniref:hypothetical protein n=1 Tax=Archangium sp. TaxID=1872627 RepID=UPI002E332614|nr:hypothetical protein [Archangium sp.]HEX5749813.1 hypothetical protein [Archangium sp.]
MAARNPSAARLETPAKVDTLTNNINAGLLDQRSWATRLWDRNPEPPLQSMIDHLEK